MENRRHNDVPASRIDNYVGDRAARRPGALDAGAASVLRNTYMLLSLTVGFSALVAWFSMGAQPPGFLITLVGFYGLLFLTYRLRNSVWGIASVFALTGFMGYTLGPIIGMFVSAARPELWPTP